MGVKWGNECQADKGEKASKHESSDYMITEKGFRALKGVAEVFFALRPGIILESE